METYKSIKASAYLTNIRPTTLPLEYALCVWDPQQIAR